MAKLVEAKMAEFRELVRAHPGVWMEGYTLVLDKHRQWIRPRLNIFQARMVAAYMWCLANDVPPRLIGLKPRQVGGTTVAAGISTHHAKRFNSKGAMIADILERSSNLFRMVCSFAQKDEFDWGFGVRTPTEKYLTFENGSEIVKRSADTPTAGRSDTLTIVHASEVAYWKDTSVKNARDVYTALMNALANHTSTLGIIESTPHGAMGLFYEQWQSARWPVFDDYWTQYSIQPSDDGNGWLRVFAAWFEFPEHRESVRRGSPLTDRETDKIMSTLTDREKQGIEKYGWDADQIAWRRWKIKNDCLNDDVRFDEEYPEDPQRCFLASGRPRFDTAGVAAIEIRSRSTRHESGILVRQSNGVVTYQATGENEAWAWIWERPRVGCKYLISIDTMRGESETARTQDSDCHSILVWRAAYRDHEGTIHPARLVARVAPPCRLDNKPAAMQVDLLSRWYGRCIAAVEINNGIGMLKELRDLGVPLYRMASWDKVKQQSVSQLGWETNKDTRPMIIDELASRIREQNIDIACPHLANQLQTFIIDSKGRAEAQSGCHDDDVLSAAIGTFCLEAATEMMEETIEPRLPDDWDRWKTV